jgi:GNAT superfamily N-acetyltransferase
MVMPLARTPYDDGGLAPGMAGGDGRPRLARVSSTTGGAAALLPAEGPQRVVVRPATDAELDAAGDVVLAAYRADGLAGPRYLALVGDARARARDAVVAVAVDGTGQVLGSVTFALAGSPWAQVAGPGQAEFRMLGVAPSARGRGIGGALVDWCLDHALAAGANEVVISSATTMRAAHRLYAMRGFARRPELDWSPEAGIDLWGFALPLSPAR